MQLQPWDSRVVFDRVKTVVMTLERVFRVLSPALSGLGQGGARYCLRGREGARYQQRGNAGEQPNHVRA